MTPVPKGYVLDDSGVLWHHSRAPRVRPNPARFDSRAFHLEVRLREMQLAEETSSAPHYLDNAAAAQEHRRDVLFLAVREYEDERADRKRGAA